jgi:two-component system phosphate regulon response regulator OmpR
LSITTSPAQAPQRDLLDEETPHLLIIDDDRRIRELLKRYLSDNGYRVSTAESASDAREKLRSLTFDLLVLDVMMPGETGFELTRDLRRRSDVPVLLLTALAETEERIEGLETGADDYLSKPFEPKELLLRIRMILKRFRTFGPCRLDAKNGRLWRDDEPVRLTDRELQLLTLFANRPGQIFSRDDIREDEQAGGERAVDVQINRLRRKIERDPKNPLYLQTVRGAGYVFKPD